MSIVLSNRQNPMLQAFVSLGQGGHMSMKDAQGFDQRPFRSMLIRGWVAYRRGHGFHLTKEGRKAWDVYHNTDIARKDPSLPLTAYFDPDTYGLKTVGKSNNLHVMKRKVA